MKLTIFFILITCISFRGFGYNEISDQFNTNYKGLKTDQLFDMRQSLGLIISSRINKLVYNAVLNGKIKAYYSSNLLKENTKSIDEIRSTGRAYNEWGGESDYIDTNIYQSFEMQSICGYYFSLILEQDTTDYNSFAKPYAFGLAYTDTFSGVNKGKFPLFWISFDELNKIISQEDMQSLQSALLMHITAKIDRKEEHYGNYPFETEIEHYLNNTTCNHILTNRTNHNLLYCDYIDNGNNLYHNALYGSLKAYSNDSIDLGARMLPEILKLRGREEEYVGKYDHNDITGERIIDTIVYIDFNPDSICGLSVSEIWSFDTNNKAYVVNIIGIGLLFNIHMAGMNLGKYILCSFKYQDIETFLGKQEQQQLSNWFFNSLIRYYLN